MAVDPKKLSLSEDDKVPFERFMFQVLDLWYTDGLRTPHALGERARALLTRYRKPSIPEGASAPEFAKALVVRTDETGGIDPLISFGWLMDALTAWPDCAEAYMWVSNIVEGQSQGPMLMQPFYAISLDALDRRLAAMGLTVESPGFREVEEFQLYLTSLRGLGEVLATYGDFASAAERYQQALHLDPDDGHEVLPRYALVKALLKETAATDGALAYCPDTAMTRFMRAVITYGREADSPTARRALQQARQANPHVMGFLNGTRKWIGHLTGDSKPGGVDEAQYITLALAPAFPPLIGLERWFRKEGGVVKPAPGAGKPGHKRRR